MGDKCGASLESSKKEQIKGYDMQLVKKAIYLSWFTIVYNVVEGMVSVWFGVSEGSFALAGFGLDSWVEVSSATLVLWRFSSEALGEKQIGLARERRATSGIGWLFILLALLTFVGGSYRLFTHQPPDSALPGLIISLLSLGFMFFLWFAKLKVAKALNSSTMKSDAACSLACIKLSSLLFIGSLVFIMFPSLWWADPLAALFIAFLIAGEGRGMIKAAASEDFSGGCGCS